jgi:hypothetical protein
MKTVAERTQLFFWALLAGQLFIFWRWLVAHVPARHQAINGLHSCWSFWPSCGDAYVLEQYPYASSLNAAYLVVFATALAAAWLAARQQWTAVRGLAFALFALESFGILVARANGTPAIIGHWVLSAAWLVAPGGLVAMSRLLPHVRRTAVVATAIACLALTEASDVLAAVTLGPCLVLVWLGDQ